MTLRSLIPLSVPVCSAVLLTACAVDVPVPDDPDAQEWSPKVKAAYSGWQPPVKMPDGNPEYQTALNKNAAAKKQAVSAVASIEKGITPPAPAVKEPAPKSDEEAEAKTAPVNTQLSKNATKAAAPVKEEPKAEVKAEPVKPEVKADTKGEVKAEPVKPEAKPVAPVEVEAKADAKAEQPVKAEVKADVPAKLEVKAAPAKAEPAKDKKVQKTDVKTKMVVDESAAPAEYIVKDGDSLSLIAKSQYKNGNLWPILMKANKTVLKNSDKIKAGMKLSIPVLKSVPVGEK